MLASSTVTRRELGWAPKHAELNDIVQSAWQWHQKRYPQT